MIVVEVQEDEVGQKLKVVDLGDAVVLEVEEPERSTEHACVKFESTRMKCGEIEPPPHI